MGVNKIYLSEARDFVSKAFENVADEEFMLGMVDLKIEKTRTYVFREFIGNRPTEGRSDRFSTIAQ